MKRYVLTIGLSALAISGSIALMPSSAKAAVTNAGPTLCVSPACRNAAALDNADWIFDIPVFLSHLPTKLTEFDIWCEVMDGRGSYIGQTKFGPVALPAATGSPPSITYSNTVEIGVKRFAGPQYALAIAKTWKCNFFFGPAGYPSTGICKTGTPCIYSLNGTI